MSRILPLLYLGDQQATKTLRDIDVIISIGCNHKSSLRNLEIYKFSITDSSTSDLRATWDQSCGLIQDKIQNNQRILVHCKGGINRSPMVVVAYLCKYCHYSINEAVAEVTTKRKSARIQPHYLNQLIEWLGDGGGDDVEEPGTMIAERDRESGQERGRERQRERERETRSHLHSH
jgi:hypothetical protein